MAYMQYEVVGQLPKVPMLSEEDYKYIDACATPYEPMLEGAEITL